MGLKSGEYGGRYSNLTPASEHNRLTRSEWWKNTLSIISTDFGSGHLPQCWRSCSINHSKNMASVEPLIYGIEKYYPESIPARSDNGLRWNLGTCTGATPSGDQPVRLWSARLTHPDSSTKTRWYEWNSDKLCWKKSCSCVFCSLAFCRTVFLVQPARLEDVGCWITTVICSEFLRTLIWQKWQERLFWHWLLPYERKEPSFYLQTRKSLPISLFESTLKKNNLFTMKYRPRLSRSFIQIARKRVWQASFPSTGWAHEHSLKHPGRLLAGPKEYEEKTPQEERSNNTESAMLEAGEIIARSRRIVSFYARLTVSRESRPSSRRGFSMVEKIKLQTVTEIFYEEAQQKPRLVNAISSISCYPSFLRKWFGWPISIHCTSVEDKRDTSGDVVKNR